MSGASFGSTLTECGGGFALSLGKVTPLAVKVEPREIRKGFTVPQSFSYVDEDFFGRVQEKIKNNGKR